VDLKGDGGVLLQLKEIGALEVPVALGFAGVEGGYVEGGLDGGEGCVAGVLRKIAGNALDGALYVGDHHVLDFEFGYGVGRIDFSCDERGGG
jgi:hypothetical protein